MGASASIPEDEVILRQLEKLQAEDPERAQKLCRTAQSKLRRGRSGSA